MIVVLARWAANGVFAAAMIAFALFALAVFLGPMLMLSAAVMGFVTMSQSSSQALRVLAIASISSVVFFALLNQMPAVGGQLALALWLPVMVLGAVYRRSGSLAIVSAVAVGLSLLLWFWLDQKFGGLESIIFDYLNNNLALLNQQLRTLGAELDAKKMKDVAALLPAAMFSSVAVMWVLCAWIARSWHLQLYRQRLFRDEFAQARLTPELGLGLVALGGICLLLGQGAWSNAWIIPMQQLSLLGLCVVHGLSQGSKKWTIRVPVYLAIMFLGYWAMAVLAAVACVDSLMNLRQRARNSSSK